MAQKWPCAIDELPIVKFTLMAQSGLPESPVARAQIPAGVLRNHMTTADWALVISIGSLLISAPGFIWNVWSKFIYPKAKVRPPPSRFHPYMLIHTVPRSATACRRG